MSRNGTGTYSLPEAPFVYDTAIDEQAVNNNFTDIANALTQSLSKDGQTNPSANLPMATYRHTGVGNASARTDYAAAGQVQDSAFIECGDAGGSADALTLSPSPSISAYVRGQHFRGKATATNTGAATVAISGLAGKALQRNGAALVAGDITIGKYYSFYYDGTNVQVTQISPPAPASLATQAEAEAGTDNSVVMTPLRTAQQTDARGIPFNVVSTLYSTRAVFSGITAGYATLLTASYTKKSSTSKLVVEAQSTFYMSAAGLPVSMRVDIAGNTWLTTATRNTPSAVGGGTNVKAIFTGLTAGSKTWKLELGREDATAWSAVINPTSTDNVYFQSTGYFTSFTIYEVET